MLGLRLSLSAGFLVIVASEFTGHGYLINCWRSWFRGSDMLLNAELFLSAAGTFTRVNQFRYAKSA